jgi:mannan endo-1,4-beta-mannosidase
MKKLLFLAGVVSVLLTACQPAPPAVEFVKTNGVQFMLNGKPLYYVGANYWYGAILGSTGRGGNRERLIKELDMMKEHGITNLRVMVGAEGPDNQPYRVTPALQLSPGVYNDTILDGLDFFMAEMGKRNMHAVLFLHNTWEWSGGYSQYVNWHGGGDIPYPQIAPNTWPQFMAYAAQFLSCDSCRLQFQNHIRFILGRTNSYTQVKYVDDPSVMTWEIANEPRALSEDNKEVFAQWISETAALIKSLAPKQLVTTGTEGSHGCEADIDLFRTIHADPNIDYLTFHIWPKNWGWLDTNRIPDTVDSAIVLTNAYIERHLNVARLLNKPAVFEEFGLPRDHQRFDLDDSTTARDKYYQNAFNLVEEHARRGDALAASNFWAIGGTGRAAGDENPFWSNGDDLMGDPPQEEQGLNSVFDTDSTMSLVKAHAQRLSVIVGQ